MHTKIPPISEIKGQLKTLRIPNLHALSALSDVPFTTLLKIRAGVTTNPGIETVRKFAPYFKQARKAITPAVHQSSTEAQ